MPALLKERQQQLTATDCEDTASVHVTQTLSYKATALTTTTFLQKKPVAAVRKVRPKTPTPAPTSANNTHSWVPSQLLLQHHALGKSAIGHLLAAMYSHAVPNSSLLPDTHTVPAACHCSLKDAPLAAAVTAAACIVAGPP